ncbi:MAG: DUF6455 family protein [Pseudomonadota bacterium]
MLNNTTESKIDPLENRIALRKAMLQVTGVRLKSKGRVPKDLEDQIRASIIACFDCQCSEFCRAWLAKASEGAIVPKFCLNFETFERWRAIDNPHEVSL